MSATGRLKRLQADLPEQPTAATERVLCQCVKRLLSGLPEQYQDVLKQVDLDGVPLKEAASTLGLTTNNLTVRLHRARHRLRTELRRSCKVCSKHGCLDCACKTPESARAHRARN
jgi:RNA polymerase sigma-70 factor (ECF subfamily)